MANSRLEAEINLISLQLSETSSWAQGAGATGRAVGGFNIEVAMPAGQPLESVADDEIRDLIKDQEELCRQLELEKVKVYAESSLGWKPTQPEVEDSELQFTERVRRLKISNHRLHQELKNRIIESGSGQTHGSMGLPGVQRGTVTGDQGLQS